MVHNGRLIIGGLVLAVVLGGAAGCQPDASEPLAVASDSAGVAPPVRATNADTLAGAPARAEGAWPALETDAEPLAGGDSVAATVGVAPDSAGVAAPVLATYADTLAWRVYEASGGPVWETLPYLRFHYAVSRDGVRQLTYKHFWNRRTGDYRVEWRGPGGEPYVVLLNVVSREGEAYWKGSRMEASSGAEHLTRAYRRYVDDTFWLLAPFKLFDPGVNRTYAPDSSNAETEALHLSFDDSGMTPGDEYWLFVDRRTGRLVRWTYVLDSEGPNAPPRSYVWEGYEEFVTPGGSVHFSTRKRGYATTFVIHTDAVDTPTLVPDDMFTDPGPRLKN